jgi:hypothetical protein
MLGKRAKMSEKARLMQVQLLILLLPFHVSKATIHQL